MDVFMDPGAVGVKFLAGTVGVFKLSFRQEVHNVEPEAVDTEIHPVIDHIVNFAADLFILPVQICLRDIKQSQIVLIGLIIVSPCVAAEFRLPVRRGGIISAVLPYIIITVRVVLRFPRLHKPRMCRGSMVERKVQHDFQISVMRFIHQCFQVLFRAEPGINLIIIADIIAVIFHWRLVNRRQPDIIDAKIFQVIQLFNDAPYITDAVTV